MTISTVDSEYLQQGKAEQGQAEQGKAEAEQGQSFSAADTGVIVEWFVVRLGQCARSACRIMACCSGNADLCCSAMQVNFHGAAAGQPPQRGLPKAACSSGWVR